MLRIKRWAAVPAQSGSFNSFSCVATYVSVCVCLCECAYLQPQAESTRHSALLVALIIMILLSSRCSLSLTHTQTHTCMHSSRCRLLNEAQCRSVCLICLKITVLKRARERVRGRECTCTHTHSTDAFYINPRDESIQSVFMCIWVCVCAINHGIVFTNRLINWTSWFFFL